MGDVPHPTATEVTIGTSLPLLMNAELPSMTCTLAMPLLRSRAFDSVALHRHVGAAIAHRPAHSMHARAGLPAPCSVARRPAAGSACDRSVRARRAAAAGSPGWSARTACSPGRSAPRPAPRSGCSTGMTSAAVRYFRSMTSRDCARTGQAIRQTLIRTPANRWRIPLGRLMASIVPQLPPPGAEAAFKL